MSSATEHETFAKLTDSLSKAASEAKQMSVLRSDQSAHWEAISMLLDQIKDKVFDIAMSRIN